MKKDTIYTLLTRYFRSECTEEEIQAVKQWYRESDENRKEFLRLKNAWIVSDTTLDKKISRSEEKVWNRIVSRIEHITPYRYTKRNLITYSIASAAATLLLILSLQYLFTPAEVTEEDQWVTIAMPKGEKGRIFLPDGTEVWLNSESKITFNNYYNINNRKVSLEGQAYFDVTKNDENRFVVATESMDVMVYGTTFDVQAYPGSETVDVTLKNGAVSVMDKEEGLLAQLEPNQMVRVNKETYAVDRKEVNAQDNLIWTQEELILEYVAAEELFAKIENWYGVTVDYTGAPDGLLYRLRIKNESLAELLRLINGIKPIEYKITGKEVTIRYR